MTGADLVSRFAGGRARSEMHRYTSLAIGAGAMSACCKTLDLTGDISNGSRSGAARLIRSTTTNPPPAHREPKETDGRRIMPSAIAF